MAYLCQDFLDIRINPEFQHKKMIHNKTLTNENNLVNYKDFNHNEWSITNIEYETTDMEYLCCPDELWTITNINIFMT